MLINLFFIKWFSQVHCNRLLFSLNLCISIETVSIRFNYIFLLDIYQIKKDEPKTINY